MGTAIGELLERQNIELDFLAGKTVGVDSYNIIYQFLSSIRGSDGTPLMDSEGNVTSHLTGILYRTANLFEKGIKPVFVFDGKPHKLKAETIKKRHEIRTEAIAKHEKALKEGDLEQARKFGSRALKLTEPMLKDARELIQALGFPIVEAPMEGEAQISVMCSNGVLYGAASQDYDCLLFGAPKVFRNIAVTGKRKVPGKNYYVDISPEFIDLKKNLEALGISRQKLVWLGILIGTDFNEKFPRIGPKTALKLVKESGSFESVCEKAKFRPEFDYKEVEEIFLKPQASEEFKIEFKAPNSEKVLEFLCEKHDFSRERVESVLKKLGQKASEKGSQQSLSAWFK
ncbi:MAG TPA: flap endonuclease-1 [Candidatus Diapherotrites archaeon]|uniref:Flap endonuclease 1 n=1 Tax=Candidatus Iainarchaeum sp. TaxID=3101447 RepID=A0A7J4KRY7_9ARCH|nr:flap endonuclease-1 [Candidatus Diapherotrites archaeon]